MKHRPRPPDRAGASGRSGPAKCGASPLLPRERGVGARGVGRWILPGLASDSWADTVSLSLGFSGRAGDTGCRRRRRVGSVAGVSVSGSRNRESQVVPQGRRRWDRDSSRGRGTGAQASGPGGERGVGAALGVSFTLTRRVKGRRGPRARSPQPASPSTGSRAREAGRTDGRPRRPLAPKSQDRREAFVARPGEGAGAKPDGPTCTPSSTPGVSPPSAPNLRRTQPHNVPSPVTVQVKGGRFRPGGQAWVLLSPLQSQWEDIPPPLGSVRRLAVGRTRRRPPGVLRWRLMATPEALGVPQSLGRAPCSEPGTPATHSPCSGGCRCWRDPPIM